jgi:hypothetical protein
VTNVLDMKVQKRLIEEAREARAKRKAERDTRWLLEQHSVTEWLDDVANDSVKYPVGIDDIKV